MHADNGKWRMREKFGWPIGTHRRTKLPCQGATISSDPCLVTFPFRLCIKHKAICPLIENIIRDAYFRRYVRAIRTVITKNQYPICMGDAAQVTGELRKPIGAIEQLVTGGGFDHDVTNTLALVI